MRTEDLQESTKCQGLQLLQPLNFMQPRDFSQACHDLLQVSQIFDVEQHLHTSLGIGGAGLDVADIRVGIPNDRGDLLQHPKAVVAHNHQPHRIRGWRFSGIVGPSHFDATLGLVEEIRDIGTLRGMHGDALSARDVPGNSLTADRVTTASTINHEIAVALGDDGVALAAEDAADNTGYARVLGFALKRWDAGSKHPSQNLLGGILAIADSSEKIIRAAKPIVSGDALQIFIAQVFEGNAIFASLLVDQLASDFNGALTLVDIEPVPDFLPGAGGFNKAEPVAAGLVGRLQNDFNDIAGVQLVTDGHHAAVDAGAHATVPDIRMDGISEINWGGIARQDDDLAFGGEGIDLFGVKVDLEGRKEFIRIWNVTLPLHHLTQPGQALLILSGDRSIFVFPVGGDPFLRHLVHFLGSNLDLKRHAVFRDN